MYQSVPIGSLLQLPPEQRLSYIEKVVRLPKSIATILMEERTGAYIRGLVRSFQLPLEQAPLVAFLTLQVGVGDTRLEELPRLITRQLGVAVDKAQAMARDIEKELFAPVMADLSAVMMQKKEQKPFDPAQGKDDLALDASSQLPNTLDLKNTPPKRR